jgi:hypothetical protein
MRIRCCRTILSLAAAATLMGLLVARPVALRAQETGQLASDILGSTDLLYNPTFFGYALQAGPTAHSFA